MDPSRINPPELFKRAHKRIPSLSPTRSPTRQRLTDDILSDLSPATTLEAFTNPSGKLRASVEAATPSQRAFGIRATTASKKIQEWVDELATWPWPSAAGSAGFEVPAAKRRRISIDERTPRAGYQDVATGEEEYIGSLPAVLVAQYENRVDDIHEDMDDLNVEEIKSTVLNTHFSPKSRPSSSGSNAPSASLFSSFTRMDDFTAVVTATVLQALPNLSKLMRLMDVWTVRLLVLRKVPPLLNALQDVEVVLKSNWEVVENPGQNTSGTSGGTNDDCLDRQTFEVMRNVLLEKVTNLGKDLDYMLDTLEGQQDTLPEIWLDQMEAIEGDYGEWVVRGDRKVREGEWEKVAKARKAEADRIKAEEEAIEAKRKRREAEKLRLEEAVRIELEKLAAEEAIRLEIEAAELAWKQEQERIALEEAHRLEEERIASEEALRLEEERIASEEALRLEQERIASEEVLRLERLEEERVASEEASRLEQERLAAEEVSRREQEAAKVKRQAELAREQMEARVASEEAARYENERAATEELRRLEQEAAEAARKSELARKQDEDRNSAIQEASRLEQGRLAAEQAATRAAWQAELDRKKQEGRFRALQEATQSERQQRAATESARLVQTKVAQIEEDARRQVMDETALRKAEKERSEQAERGLAEESTRQAVVVRMQEEEAPGSDELNAAEVHDPTPKEDLEHSSVESQTDHTATYADLEGLQTANNDENDVDREEAQSLETALQTTNGSIAPVIASPTTTAVSNSGQNEALKTHRQEITLQASPAAEPSASDQGNFKERLASRKDDHVLDTSRFETVFMPASLSPSSPVARFPPFDGSDESNETTGIFDPDTSHIQRDSVSKIEEIPEPVFVEEIPGIHRAQTPEHPSVSERSWSPQTPSKRSAHHTPGVIETSPIQITHSGAYNAIGVTGSPSEVARVRHGDTSLLGRSSSPQKDIISRTTSSELQPRSPAMTATVEPPVTPPRMVLPERASSISSPSSKTSISPPLLAQSPAREDGSPHLILAEPAIEYPDDKSESSTANTDDGNSTHNGLDRTLSIASGYSIFRPSPEILKAEPAEYFRPMLSPIRSTGSRFEADQETSLPKSPMPLSGDGNMEEPLLSRDDPDGCPTCLARDEALGTEEIISEPFESSIIGLQTETTMDDIGSSIQSSSDELDAEQATPPALARKTSIAHINSPARKVDIPPRQGSFSEVSTIISQQPGDTAASPLSQISPSPAIQQPDLLLTHEDESPSKGRTRFKGEQLNTHHRSASPPPIPPMSPRRSSHIPRPSASSKTVFDPQDLTTAQTEAPVFDNVELSEASVLLSPKKNSDEQIQAQISSLLESIPARIRLTSEPETTFIPLETLRPIKTRRSVASLRSHSSMSMRATTPSFTLAPAYGKGTSRPRPQSNNPEIKLYHLSRSTGEAPIKLFVRLVGENGERVMVRVGGGWADLGEYLREYASHHGRRSGADSDKVEIQDIRPRVVSNASTASTSTLRGTNGRSSPVSRPGSAFDRPMSSLHIRKTRRSVGETDSSTLNFRNPSTPLPLPSRGRGFETPPSEAGRSVSRMSWTEEEGGLGLAGPKAKKVTISEQDEEWVESMKEKVRLASAEKERKERNRERKSFGEMDRVGGTKRLFKKK